MRKIAVIDGNSLMHRAFHAVPTYMMTPDGRHTNAVFGFVSMLLKLIEQLQPDAIVCAFDAGIPKFRMEAIEVYKAQRPPTDPDLKEQFPMMESLLQAMNIPVVKVAGYEGDDILGTLAAMNEQQGDQEMYIVSGDRDIFQLATQKTKVVATRVGLSDIKVYGPDEVIERYGVGPDLVPDFIALKGDSSDNIPGVPGVGEKTAAKLLNQWGSVQGIIDNADKLQGKVKANVQESVDQLRAGLLVATIVRDLDIDLDLSSVSFPSFDPATVIEAFKELNITSHVSKILSLQDDGSSASTGTQANVGEVRLVADDLAWDMMQTRLPEDALVSVILEDVGGEMLFGGNRKIAVCIGEEAAIFREDDIQVVLKGLLESNTIVTLDAKAMLQELVPADSSIDAQVDIGSVDPNRIFDLGVAGYLLSSDRSSYGIEYLAFEYLGMSLPAREKPKRGKIAEELSDEELAKRARVLYQLRDIMWKRLQEEGSDDCFTQIEMPLVPVLVQLERAGLQLDVPRVHELSASISDDIASLQDKIYELVGEEFNIGSPKQLSSILFEKLNLPAGKKTRSGYSTDASVLESLSKRHPVPGLVLEYRELTKISGTYLEPLPTMLRGDGRLHTTFNQTVAATGRLSSSDPNLQNIPVRTELGRQIRTAFGPYRQMLQQPQGAVFLSADYSQIELRLLAHLSGDQGLIDAFVHGSDFHQQTAARVFDVSPEQVTPEMRSRAKAVNFGIVYGQQAFGLGKSLHIPMREAQEMIDRYFAAYPQVKVYLDGLVEQAKVKGYVETMFGRKRHVPEVMSTNMNQRAAGERVAMNHPMQGSAADIIKKAMINVAKRMRTDGFTSVMMLQIHDELDFSCPTDEIERLSQMVIEEMSGVVQLKVPLNVSVAYGPTWADAK